MRTLLLTVTSIALASCGGGGGSDIDARVFADAAPASVHMVACTGSPPLIVTSNFMYSPTSVTIAPGGLVHFQLEGIHNVVSTTPGENFSLGFGADACLQFDVAGTFTFKCGPHNFTGSVMVQ